MITGATGHIGKELVKELAERKVAFRAMVRSLSKGLNRQIEYVDVPSQGMLETYCLASDYHNGKPKV